MKNLKAYVTVKEAARILGVHPATLRNWDLTGKLKAVRHPVNGYRLYLEEELKHILEEIEGRKSPEKPAGLSESSANVTLGEGA